MAFKSTKDLIQQVKDHALRESLALDWEGLKFRGTETSKDSVILLVEDENKEERVLMEVFPKSGYDGGVSEGPHYSYTVRDYWREGKDTVHEDIEEVDDDIFHAMERVKLAHALVLRAKLNTLQLAKEYWK